MPKTDFGDIRFLRRSRSQVIRTKNQEDPILTHETMRLFLIAIACITSTTDAFHVGQLPFHGRKYCFQHLTIGKGTQSNEEFQELDDADGLGFVTQSNKNPSTFPSVEEVDLSGATYRQFLLGADVELTDFIGSLGFDEIVDWEYYDQTNEEVFPTADKSRVVVEPSPFDPTQPKRTRSSSGSVIRLYLGKLLGELGASLRSRGMDSRVLVKEFVGDSAADLASAELSSLSKLQTALILSENDFENETFSNSGELLPSWASTAKLRNSVIKNARQSDNANVVQLVQLLQKEKVPYVYILGSMEVGTDGGTRGLQLQDWYRSFGVSPPKSSSIWIIYEYAGLRHTGLYAQPADVIKSVTRPPVKFAFPLFSAPVPVMPSWQERANYVVNGILKKSLEAVAYLHENGIVHRSIGRSSIILSSVGMDKSETASLEAKSVDRLVIKLADFGFSSTIAAAAASAAKKGSLGSSAQSRYTSSLRLGSSYSSTSSNPFFSVAEDLHALGLVFLGVLLTSLADFSDWKVTNKLSMPQADEDRIQRVRVLL